MKSEQNKLEFVIDDIDSLVMRRPGTIQRVLNKFAHAMGLNVEVKVESAEVVRGIRTCFGKKPLPIAQVQNVEVTFLEVD